MRRIGNRRLCLAALALLAPVQLLSIAGSDPDRDEPAAAPAPRTVDRPAPSQLRLAPAVAAATAEAAPPAAAPTVELVTEADGATPTAPLAPAAPPASAGTTFAERFPAQAAATQDPAVPATTRWALLIGINEHRGTVADNIGSRQDAEDLRAQLLARGWLDDHILLLTDRQATRDDIVAGIAWLADKTDDRSAAVFHYSGHSKKWYGQDVDGDGEVTDEGLWPSDDRFIVDSELVRLLDPVQPAALWISFATCNAGGFADPGLARPGRILTFSSNESQKSYEHPSWRNSVWGWLLIEQAVGAGLGDLDHDGRVTVEEAFVWARPRATETTRGQRHGSQDGVVIDQLEGDFDLAVPGAPTPPPTPPPDPGAQDPAPQPAPAPDQSPPPRQPDPPEEDDGNRICLLCGG